jgi:hypothetical protein
MSIFALHALAANKSAGRTFVTHTNFCVVLAASKQEYLAVLYTHISMQQS